MGIIIDSVGNTTVAVEMVVKIMRRDFCCGSFLVGEVFLNVFFCSTCIGLVPAQDFHFALIIW